MTEKAATGTPVLTGRRAMRHVTDSEAPVYGIVGLPEEVVAVLLAYVSRSPKSFREHLDDLLEEGLVEEGQPRPASGDGDGPAGVFTFAQEKARAFHERWVVGYGHSSVAEHAVAHLGVEGISRLASAALELSNPFLSFTEFSQRYQAPVRGAFVTPPELVTLSREWQERYQGLMDELFDAYIELREALAGHAITSGRVTAREGETPERLRKRARRLAFEDARYALPLAVKSSLGMTANGRALRDAVARLRMDPLEEVRCLADRLCAQGEALLPTLLRHTEAPVPVGADARYPAAFGGEGVRSVLGRGAGGLSDGVPALLGATGLRPGGIAAEADAEAEAIRRLSEEMRLTGEAGSEDPIRTLEAWRAAAGLYAEGPDALHAVRYRFAMRLSEAAWHQLLRHVRGTHFAASPAVAEGPLTVPPMVARSGLRPVLERAAAASQAFSAEVRSAAPEGASVAPYAVLNAHQRTVVADLDLWELDHLVRLRLRDNAQWDVRRTVRSLGRAAISVHPFLIRLWGEDVLRPLDDETS